MAIQREMTDALIKEWARLMNIDLPELKFSDWMIDSYSYTMGNGEDLVFFIKEGSDDYQVGLFPDYEVTVSASCLALGLAINEVGDYDCREEDLYDSMANNPIPQWVRRVKMDPPTIRPSDEMLLDDAIDAWVAKDNDIEELVRWYVHEIYLPAFLDQTAKHATKEIMSGMPRFTIEDVCAYFEEKMLEGESPECLLDEVSTFLSK